MKGYSNENQKPKCPDQPEMKRARKQTTEKGEIDAKRQMRSHHALILADPTLEHCLEDMLEHEGETKALT